MKQFAILISIAGFWAAASSCSAESRCNPSSLRSSFEASAGVMTLADLLESDACSKLRKLAEEVSLGKAPLPGSERVLERSQVRQLLARLDYAPALDANVTRIPERIVIRRRGANKSCADVARVVRGAMSQSLDCSSVRGIPQEASLELLKTDWNARLRRWEFALRCVKPQDCVPFLVWAVANPGVAAAGVSAGLLRPEAPPAERNLEDLIKPGQSAILIWERESIRVAVTVTCLDAGRVGEVIRVRIQNASRILRAEVLADRTLRAVL